MSNVCTAILLGRKTECFNLTADILLGWIHIDTWARVAVYGFIVNTIIPLAAVHNNTSSV